MTPEELLGMYVAWCMGATVQFKFEEDDDDEWTNCLALSRFKGTTNNNNHTSSLVYTCANDPSYMKERKILLRLKPKE